MQHVSWYRSNQEAKMIKNTEIAYIIDEYVHNEMHRALLKRRYIDGICFEPLADEFNISTRQAQRIVYKYENKILPKLTR